METKESESEKTTRLLNELNTQITELYASEAGEETTTVMKRREFISETRLAQFTSEEQFLEEEIRTFIEHPEKYRDYLNLISVYPQLICRPIRFLSLSLPNELHIVFSEDALKAKVEQFRLKGIRIRDARAYISTQTLYVSGGSVCVYDPDREQRSMPLGDPVRWLNERLNQPDANALLVVVLSRKSEKPKAYALTTFEIKRLLKVEENIQIQQLFLSK